MKFLKAVSGVVACTLFMGLLSGCGAAKEEGTGEKNPLATITLKDGRKIQLELYPDKAPNTVRNFIYLANTKKFYDGLIFHRVISNFMIQGGCPQGTGMGGPGYQIKGEFPNNGFAKNDIEHKKGVLSMARNGISMDSAGSQFFICSVDCEHLDGDYAPFGMTVSGLETVVDISNVATGAQNRPIEPVTIDTIRVETYGTEYALPETSPQVK